VGSTAVVLAGVVAVQSGIAGTSALPVLPHRASAAHSSSDAQLPAPAEPTVPPPAAGEVREPAPDTRGVIVPDPGRAFAAHRRPATRPGSRDKDDSGKDSPDRSGKAKDPKDAEKSPKHPDDELGEDPEGKSS